MSSPLRQLTTGAVRRGACCSCAPTGTRLMARAAAAQSIRQGPEARRHHTVAPWRARTGRGVRIEAALAARGRAVGGRGYRIQAGEEEVPGGPGKKMDDDTRVNLGKTISILKDSLPTILQQPLPSSILADNISLHLFPSTHPHLPVASGKAAYKAALWTSPLAWNRLPIIGSVGIEVQSVRLQPGPLPFAPARAGSLEDVLVVRWVTEPSSMPSEFLRDLAARISGGGGGGGGGEVDRERDAPKEFMGLFAFQFDAKGRILDHTIESAEHSRHWGKGVGSTVVRFTDRVLRGIRQRGDPDPLPMPTYKRWGRKW